MKKKVLVLVLAICMALIPVAALAKYSPRYIPRNPVTKTTEAVQGSLSGGAWRYVPETNTWYYDLANGSQYVGWGFLYNPYAVGSQSAIDWFYFDAQGRMLTGWQWIKAADGLMHRYYLHEVSDGSLGHCYISTTTPDGLTVNANGEWTVEGVAMSK